MDRPARFPLRVVLRLPHNLRVARTSPTILITRTRRDMLRVAMHPITDLNMALITATIECKSRDNGVGLEPYLIGVVYRNSSVEGQ